MSHPTPWITTAPTAPAAFPTRGRPPSSLKSPASPTRKKRRPLPRPRAHRQTLHQPPPRPLLHQHPSTSRQQPARLRRPAHHAHRPATLRRRRNLRPGRSRSDHLYAYRFPKHQPGRPRCRPLLHRRTIRRQVSSRKSQLLRRQSRRPGSPRSHPPHRRHALPRLPQRSRPLR